MSHRGPRIGRPDRLALYDAPAPANGGPPLRSLVPARRDSLRRFHVAPDVADQLALLPAALDELAKRLAGVVHRAQAGRHDVAADAAALQDLDQLRDRAWRLFLAVGRTADRVQTSARRESVR